MGLKTGDIAGTDYLEVDATGNVKIAGFQVITERQLGVTDATTMTSYTPTLEGYGFLSSTEMNTFISKYNTLVASYNSLLAKLRTHGLIDT